jgi:hypothetical protein
MENASRIERRIASRLIETILKDGLNISVQDGEETTVSRSKDKAAIIAALATTDLDRLTVWSGAEKVGCIWLVWGNEDDLISDSTDDDYLNELIRRAA